jgi:hypothetical protein
VPPEPILTKRLDDAILDLAALVTDDHPTLSGRDAELADQIADIIKDWIDGAKDEAKEEEE